jgi:adenylate cyclase
MTTRRFIVAVLALGALNAYLFASAPPLLPEKAASGTAIPIERVFAIVASENDAVRTLWTTEFVGKGKAVGLRFDEHWRDEELEAGPLPSLFLRETARSLEKDPVRLSLFLGSDFPLNPANRFQGVQVEKFALIRQNREPQFFYAADTGLFTAMFSDIAVAPPCIECHNDHPDAPKRDWRLNEVMGATTWSYPEATVSPEEALQIVAALRNGFRAAYSAYLAKAETFARRPEIGARWPRDGYFLPSPEAFMAEIEARVSGATLNGILAAAIPPKPAADAVAHPAGVSGP